jgi:hypothetical protein
MLTVPLRFRSHANRDSSTEDDHSRVRGQRWRKGRHAVYSNNYSLGENTLGLYNGESEIWD